MLFLITVKKGFWINDPESCVFIEDGSITVRNTYFASNERDFTNRCGENTLFEATGSVVGTSNILENPFSLTNPNFMLNVQGREFPVDPSAATLEWFEPADYIGAVGNEDWTAPLRAASE